MVLPLYLHFQILAPEYYDEIDLYCAIYAHTVTNIGNYEKYRQDG